MMYSLVCRMEAQRCTNLEVLQPYAYGHCLLTTQINSIYDLESTLKLYELQDATGRAHIRGVDISIDVRGFFFEVQNQLYVSLVALYVVALYVGSGIGLIGPLSSLSNLLVEEHHLRQFTLFKPCCQPCELSGFFSIS
ncbi:hypothetical protein DFH27DRAFT_597070 [Peziza echinospora]|nr:hypothetical protein DFH27DRAFT_597070 [Peziza echinospora]